MRNPVKTTCALGDSRVLTNFLMKNTKLCSVHVNDDLQTEVQFLVFLKQRHAVSTGNRRVSWAELRAAPQWPKYCQTNPVSCIDIWKETVNKIKLAKSIDIFWRKSSSIHQTFNWFRNFERGLRFCFDCPYVAACWSGLSFSEAAAASTGTRRVSWAELRAPPQWLK